MLNTMIYVTQWCRWGGDWSRIEVKKAVKKKHIFGLFDFDVDIPGNACIFWISTRRKINIFSLKIRLLRAKKKQKFRRMT